jgi:hypothetical protein
MRALHFIHFLNFELSFKLEIVISVSSSGGRQRGRRGGRRRREEGDERSGIDAALISAEILTIYLELIVRAGQEEKEEEESRC